MQKIVMVKALREIRIIVCDDVKQDREELIQGIKASMQEAEKELDSRFLRINRGVIVNMDAVDRMNYDSCEIDGMTFMLSRSQRAEYRRKYNDYIFGRYMDIPGEGKKKQ